MEPGKVSIVIPTYNHGRFVAAAVESALAQTYKEREVLVIDDGSTDNTREVLAPYKGRIEYIHQQNRGLSAARNTGIWSACGEYIAILDADDMWLPEKLEVQMKLFAGNLSVGLVSCGGCSVDVMGNQVTRGEERSVARYRFKDLLWGNCFSGGSNAVIRRSCFDEVGLFDESLRAAEDWDMWLRIAARYEIRVAPQTLTRIRVSGNSMSSAVNADNMLANELRVLGKLFADTLVHVNPYDKGMAYSNRYIAAAWAYFMVGKLAKARPHIIKAFWVNPLHFVMREGCCGLMARILLSRVNKVRLDSARPKG